MQNSVVKLLATNGGITQIDWRIPMDSEQAWREGLLAFQEPKELLKYLIGTFRERKRRGRLPEYEFPKVQGGDSRKRVRVYCSDYWEAQGYAGGFDIAPSRFLSAILRWEWISSSGFKCVDSLRMEIAAGNSNGKVKDFPVTKGSLLGKMA